LDWTLAITRNRDALSRIVAVLFAMISAATASNLKGATSLTLPRHLYSAIMCVLRPAESALRRLITIAAQGMRIKPGAHSSLSGIGTSSSSKTPAFCLFDPLKSDAAEGDATTASLIHFDSFANSASQQHDTEKLDEPVNATHLFARLRALRHALKTIPSQARRLARWKLKRDAKLKAGRPTRVTTLRPGQPPGWRQRKVHEIDTILRECHGLVRDMMNST
jgi:hypothetical protein